jgi:hypothetical protein
MSLQAEWPSLASPLLAWNSWHAKVQVFLAALKGPHKQPLNQTFNCCPLDAQAPYKGVFQKIGEMFQSS